METWLVYGLLAALFFGTSAVVSKVTTSEKFFGVNPVHASLLILVGIAIVFIGSVFLEGGFSLPKDPLATGAGVLTGVLWALGMYITLKALTSGADLARLAPIYNTNTLVAVVLGIILLHELPNPANALKVIVGAVLIVIGSVLVST